MKVCFITRVTTGSTSKTVVYLNWSDAESYARHLTGDKETLREADIFLDVMSKGGISVEGQGTTVHIEPARLR